MECSGCEGISLKRDWLLKESSSDTLSAFTEDTALMKLLPLNQLTLCSLTIQTYQCIALLSGNSPLCPSHPHQPWTLSLVPFPHQHFILWSTVFFFNTHIWSLFFSAWRISLFLSQPETSFQLEDSFEILHLLWVWRDLKLWVAYNIHAYHKRSLGHNWVNQMLVFRNSIITR